MKGTNKRSGISLIGLVITIIVIIILAVAVILTLSDNNPIENAKYAVERNDEAALKEEATLLYADWYLQENSPNGTPTNQDAEPYIKGNLQGNYSQELVDSLKVSNEGEIKIIAKQWKLPEDDKTVDVGDLLTPTVEGLGTEQFYVIADNGTTLTLLAKNCIDTSTNKQSYSEYTKVAFDNTTSIYANSSIRGLVKAYVDTLIGVNLEDVEEVYGGVAVSGVKGRLMWYEEANPLNGTYNNMIYGSDTAKMDYWLGSPFEGGGSPMVYTTVSYWESLTGGSVNSENLSGLRPVIKILKSSVE